MEKDMVNQNDQIKSKKTKKRAKKINVAFVCTGNTCRSPIAEFMCKSIVKKMRKLSKFNISSCGTHAENGSPMNSLSRAVLRDKEIPYANFSSSQINNAIVKKIDYYITMTSGHKVYLNGLDGVYSIAEITGFSDVGDPYGGTYQDYIEVYDYLEFALPIVIKFIENKENEKQTKL